MDRGQQYDDNDDDPSSDEDEEVIRTNQNTQHTPAQITTEITRMFQQNVKEEKNQMTVLQIRRTVREKIFPYLKFTNEFVLRQMKLREQNNMVHYLLQDLNRLDDDDVSRAKFWLTHKSEVKSVLTTRKTEVANQMKAVVVNCAHSFILLHCLILI